MECLKEIQTAEVMASSMDSLRELGTALLMEQAKAYQTDFQKVQVKAYWMDYQKELVRAMQTVPLTVLGTV